MKALFTIFIMIFFMGFAHSQEDSSETPLLSKFSIRTETTLPLFAGIGAGYEISEQFDLAFFFGLTPAAYYQLIGQVAASMGGNAAYQDVIHAAFQNNNVTKFQGQYFFDKKGQGWSLGFAGYFVTSSGDAEIDTVLAAATGKDYSSLKSLLVALGRSTKVSMQGALSVFEIRGGYEYLLKDNQFLRFFAGLAKVSSADVQLKTGLTNFESTQAGQNLLRQSESDLEKIIIDNGLTPTIGLEYNYFF